LIEVEDGRESDTANTSDTSDTSDTADTADTGSRAGGSGAWNVDDLEVWSRCGSRRGGSGAGAEKLEMENQVIQLERDQQVEKG